MPNFLLIGLLAVASTLIAGAALIVSWTRAHWRREAPARRRQEIVDRLFRAVDQALDPEPSVSLRGLQLLGALREARVLEPEDDDFIEEIAKVVVRTRLEDVGDAGELVIGTSDAARSVPVTRIVRPHELLAALIAIDVASTRGHPADPFAWRVATASRTSASADPDPGPLKRPA